MATRIKPECKHLSVEHFQECGGWSLYCRSCGEDLTGVVLDSDRIEQERDDDYERAAHRAQMNDFEDTGGRDWT